MPDQDQTITEAPDPSPVANPEELISTMDEPIVAAPLEEAQKTDEEIKGKEEVKPVESDLDRFDKHPRFQELIQSQKMNKQEIADLKAQLSEQAAPEDPKYKDIAGMEDDELQDWMVENPKEYQSNLAAQIREQVAQGIKEELTRDTEQERVYKTFDTYAADHKTFDSMWDSGELQDFISKNPGHNAISAHMAMTQENRINEAVEAARKETEATVIKNFQAKQGAKVLGSGPASTGTTQGQIAPELKDPKKYGGVNTVLAARLAERRRTG